MAIKKAKSEIRAHTKKDPFKTKKTTVKIKPSEHLITPPDMIAEAVDAFRHASDQAKYHEGEAATYKSVILNYAADEFAKRLYSGEPSGFKLQGIETIAMYVVQDASASLSEEECEAFSKKWGKKAAEDLIVRDFNSIRFNEKVLEANYDMVVSALQSLPEEVLEHLFKPMGMKATPLACEKARKYAKSPEELRDMIQQLKLRHYIR